MADEHLQCPKCEYDLHGIPEARCPECGFGFQYAALRSMAVAAELMRWAAARAVTLWAAAAVVLVVPLAARHLRGAGDRFGLVTLTWIAAVVLWIRLTGLYGAVAGVLPLVLLGVPAMLLIVTVMPVVTLVLSTALLAPAWLILLRRWPALPPAANTRLPAMRRCAVRLSYLAIILLFAATGLVLDGWSG